MYRNSKWGYFIFISSQNWFSNSLGLTNPDDEMFDDITERVSQMRRPGEDDMAYYERRYQERVSP